MEPQKKKESKVSVLGIIGLVLCIIFSLMLIFNIVIIVKGTLDPETPPAIMGITPMAVLSGSMSNGEGSNDPHPDHIEVDDIIIIIQKDYDTLKVGDVVTFRDQKVALYTTHRIIDEFIDEETGEKKFITKGDFNNTEDLLPLTESRYLGVWSGIRIPKLGGLALFMKEPLGMVVFIGIPLLAFIIYDVIRRQHAANKEDKKTAELEAELARLRAAAGETKEETTEE